MNKTIHVLDAMCGSGKSTAVIEWMNSNPHKRFLYVSPLLSESEERIPYSCATLDFVYPVSTSSRTKGEHLLQLLQEGRNISCTHEMFKLMTKEHTKTIKDNGYTIVIDEEVDMITSHSPYRKEDIIYLEDIGVASIDEDNFGRLSLNPVGDVTIMNGAYYKNLYDLVDLGMVYCRADRNSRGTVVLQLPVELLTSSEEVVLLTYMFEGSVMRKFLSLLNIDVKYINKDSHLSMPLMRSSEDIIKEASTLINLKPTPNYREVSRMALTYNFYANTATKSDYDILSKTIFNAYHYSGRKADSTIVTAPEFVFRGESSARDEDGRLIQKFRKIEHPRLPNNLYLYSKCRATNDYSDKSVAIHAYNRYIQYNLQGYFKEYTGEVLDSDMYALSELIQWIWRTRIRVGKSIDLYILSTRMRELFEGWISGENTLKLHQF